MVQIQFPARIHVLLASQAPVGLVIRRGPSKRVATMLWDRTRDEFQMGQWLKGRIYERQCDLSPNGKHFLYFARKNGDAWSAISRAPFLKAISMYSIGGGHWFGGGIWTSDSTHRLNDEYVHEASRDSETVEGGTSHSPGGVDPSLYSPRLIRDGWNLTRSVLIAKKGGVEQVFEKSITPEWTLRKLAHPPLSSQVGKSCFWEEHQLVHRASGAIVAYPDWEWADLDGTRLVWATGGKLFTGSMLAEGLANETVLFDFNGMVFSPIEAPYCCVKRGI